MAGVGDENDEVILNEDEKRILSRLTNAQSEGHLSEEIRDSLSPQDKEIGLLMAAKTVRLATMIELIENLANVNCEDEDRNNVLHILVQNYQSKDGERSRNSLLLQCVDTLINAGADINKANKENKTPILTAIERDMLEVLVHILDGARLETMEPDFLCYLLINSNGEDDVLLQCVGKLIEVGVDVNKANGDLKTPLLISAESGMFKVMIYLLDNGAKIDAKHGNLLHVVLDLFDCKEVDKPNDDLLLPCVARLVDAGVDLNEEATVDAVIVKRCTPIMKAALLGLFQVVLYLADFIVKLTAIERLKAGLHTVCGILQSYRKKLSKNERLLLQQCIDKLTSTEVADEEDVNERIDGMVYPTFMHTARRGLYKRYRCGDKMDELIIQLVTDAVEVGTCLNYENTYPDTPLLIEARHQSIHVVLYLIISAARSRYLTAKLFIALGVDYFPEIRQYTKRLLQDLSYTCVAKLVGTGAYIDTQNGVIIPPIILASYFEWLEVVLCLFQQLAGLLNVNVTQDIIICTLLERYGMKEATKSRDDLLLLCIAGVLNSDLAITPALDYQIDNTPILLAARKGLFKVVIYLIDRGVGVDCRDDSYNLLHIIFKKTRNIINEDLLLQCVVKLYEAGIDLNELDADGNTPVMVAAKSGLLDMVMYLINRGVAVHHANVQGKTLFHILNLKDCSNVDKYTQIVKTLIKIGYDINQSDIEGNTPLYYTNRLISSEMLELRCTLITMLVKAGCNVNHQNKKGENLLMFFIKNQAPVRVIKLLIKLGTDLNVTDNNGDTACSYCVKYYIDDGIKVFKHLVESGANLISSNTGVNLLHQILMYKRYQIFQYYMGLQLIVGGTTVDGETMIHLLAKLNYSYTFSAFSWMLNEEIDINQVCLHNTTPMMIASFLFNRGYLELLTKHSQIDTNLQNDQGHMALHLCIIGFTLLKEGFNKRHTGDAVITLCEQIYPIYMECVDILIDHHIDVNIQDNGGKTALMLAAMKNDRVLIKKLLAAGAVVDLLDYSGRSALQYLNIYKSRFDLTCFKMLLENGNHTILDIPCMDGNTVCQTVLCFPYFWEPREVVMLLRYLVAENCCLQRLGTKTNEISFKHISPNAFSYQERDRLRRLLYLSGAPKEQVLLALNYGDENIGDDDQGETFYSRQAEPFHTFSSNLSLKCLSRRIIRQQLGLGIKEKIKKIDLPLELYDFLLLNDILAPKCFDVKVFDDGLSDYDEDDFDSYDVDQDRDGDYKQYTYEYFTLSTDDELKTLYDDDDCDGDNDEDWNNNKDDDDNADVPLSEFYGTVLAEYGFPGSLHSRY